MQGISLSKHLRDNPSLKAVAAVATDEAYEIGCIEAGTETGLPDVGFPVSCPWTFKQLMDQAFWPDA